jgi:hypothetical protein
MAEMSSQVQIDGADGNGVAVGRDGLQDGLHDESLDGPIGSKVWIRRDLLAVAAFRLAANSSDATA